MRLVRFTQAIPTDLKKGALKIALDCAKELSAYSLADSDPFEALAQAEVLTRLEGDFELIENPMEALGVMSRGEAIFVLDESFDPAQVVGFATYKPRFPAFTSASIAYIAVAQTHRGKGLMRLIMGEMLRHYPVFALDCPVELVPMYEKFGFYVSGSQGTHIAMETGKPNGHIFSWDADELMQQPALLDAKRRITKALGAGSKEAYRMFNVRNEQARAQAADFAKSKRSH